MFDITILHQDIKSVYSQCHVNPFACNKNFMFTFFCLTVIRPWLNLPTGGHGRVICMGNLEDFFTRKTPEGHTETHKSSFFPYKQVSGRNGDHKWLRMTNAFILCDLVWKVQKSHAANREGSFKLVHNTRICYAFIYQGMENMIKEM